MKQVLLYSILLGSLLIGFVACSSDEPEIMGPALADVNGDYQNGSGSKALEIYYSDKILNGSNKTVTFSSEDKQTAIITLKNVIPGVDVLELPEVLLTSSKDQTQFLFSGTCSKTDCMVTYDGTVEKGKLTLSLTAKLFANDDVVGRWVLQEIVPGDGKFYKKQPVCCVWETTDEFEGFELVMSGIELPYSSNDVAKAFGKGLSDYMAAVRLIKEITLRSDGNLIIVYAKSMNASDTILQESDLNMLQYYVRDNAFYLVVNENMLQGTPDDGGLMSWMKVFIKQYPDGLPLQCNASESGKLVLNLDKGVLGSNQFITMIIPALSQLLPEESTYVYIPLVQNVFKNYSTAIKATTKIQLGLNFSLVKQGAR